MNLQLRLVAVLAMLVLAGCNGQQSSESAGTADRSASARATTSTSTSAPAAVPAAGAVGKVSRYDAGPRAGESRADHEASERGEKLFQTRGCSACHAFGAKKSGPDLAGVSMRRTAQWIEHQILEPDVMVKEDPISRELFAKFMMQMPKQGLTPEQAKDVIEYLKAQDAGGASAEKEESK